MEILSYFVSFLGYFPNTTLFSIICACVSSSLHLFLRVGIMPYSSFLIVSMSFYPHNHPYEFRDIGALCENPPLYCQLWHDSGLPFKKNHVTQK